MAILVSIVWGVNFVPIRWALDEVPPFALSGLRFLLAAIPMVFFVRRPALPITSIVAYGLTIGVIQFGFLFLAIKLGLAAGLASLLMQMQIFFTVALAVIFTGDRIQARQLLGGLIAFVGLGVLGWSAVQGGANASLLTIALILLASLAWGTGNIVAKHASQRHRFDMFALVVWSSLVPPLPLAALSVALEGGWAPFQAIGRASAITWLCVLFMAYAATIGGYGTWNRLLHRHSAGAVTPFSMLIPVAGLASGVLVLRETLAPTQILGATIVLAGIGITFLRRGRTQPVHALASSTGTLASEPPRPAVGAPRPAERAG